jgi:L-ascorbate metabolism protein UlaG (beta-lactamase superfamily)
MRDGKSQQRGWRETEEGPSIRPAARAVWLGHSTVLFELGGVRLLTDPLLRDRVSYLTRQVAGVEPAGYAGVDGVLLSHLHLDHTDLPSLRLVGHGTPVVVPRGGGRLLRRRGFGSVTEVGMGEEVRFGPIAVRAVHAEHPGGRTPFGARASALGYVLSGGVRIYFAGDTGAFDGMERISRPHLALLPVGGWGPLAPLWGRLPVPVPGHLDPRRAAEALRLLRPRAAVPVHWGTYAPAGLGRLVSATSGDPAADFRRHAAEITPGVRTPVLLPGDVLRLDAPTTP